MSNSNYPVYAAERVLDELPILSIDELRFLNEIAWERGALVQRSLLHGAEARLTLLGKRAIITISTLIEDQHRRRFSIAHELGHLELHRHSKLLSVCLEQDINELVIARSLPIEQEANAFAAAFLMPERFFAPKCIEEDPSLDHISELAGLFDVSLTAAARRYCSYSDEPIAIVVSERGYIKWFTSSRSFEDLSVGIDVKSVLHPQSHAVRLFEGASVPSKQRTVNAKAWLTRGKFRPDATIQEQSWFMPKYSTVLTLLLVDDEIDDEDWD